MDPLDSSKGPLGHHRSGLNHFCRWNSIFFKSGSPTELCVDKRTGMHFIHFIETVAQSLSNIKQHKNNNCNKIYKKRHTASRRCVCYLCAFSTPQIFIFAPTINSVRSLIEFTISVVCIGLKLINLHELFGWMLELAISFSQLIKILLFYFLMSLYYHILLGFWILLKRWRKKKCIIE